MNESIEQFTNLYTQLFSPDHFACVGDYVVRLRINEDGNPDINCMHLKQFMRVSNFISSYREENPGCTDEALKSQLELRGFTIY